MYHIAFWDPQIHIKSQNAQKHFFQSQVRLDSCVSNPYMRMKYELMVIYTIRRSYEKKVNLKSHPKTSNTPILHNSSMSRINIYNRPHL